MTGGAGVHMESSPVGNALAATPPSWKPGEAWVPKSEGRIAQLDRLKNLPEIQLRLCDPTRNEHAASYFVLNHCKTLDDRMQIRKLDAHGYLLNYLECLEWARHNLKNVATDKSRQMRATWAAVAYFGWCQSFLEGFTAFMTTRKEDLVDDGGERSTFKSMFGRWRHMWERLPGHLRKPVVFTHMKAVCEEMTSMIFGEAPTEDGGRSMNVSRCLIDEFAKLPHDHATYAAVKPMCPWGGIYQTTQDGPDTRFAQLQDERPEGFVFFTIDWKDDAQKREGLRETTEREAEKLGSHTSPFLEGATEGLSGDEIASEYLRSKDKSKKGLVYKGFHRDWHVARAPIPFDDRLPLIVGVDYGSTGFAAAAVGQPLGDWEVRVIGEYELAGVGGAPEHAKNIWKVIRDLGYQGSIEDVELIGGPDTDIVQTGSGQSIAGYFRKFGFVQIRQCRVRGPGSIDRRIGVVEVALYKRRVTISPNCLTLVKRFPQYRWPVNRVTGHIGGTKPVLSDANHMMDAFGYLCCEVFPKETGAFGHAAVNTPNPKAPHASTHDPDLQHMAQFEREEQRRGEAATVWDLHRRQMS